MVNKEFIVGSGGIIKDFQDRNIPQYSNNFVSVGVLIPVSEFVGLGTYGVCLATSKIVGVVETSLPSLICYSAKTLKIEGVDYIKFQCQLSSQYTNFIGQLKLTPYVISIREEIINEGEEDESTQTIIETQKTFTNTTLNVIRSIASTSDASLEEPEVADNLLALIQAKNIKLIEDYKTGTKAQAIAGCFTDYNASYYSGWLLIVKYSGGSFALLPYKNDSANEFTEVDLDGTFYKLYNYSSGTYDSLQLTYTKGEIDTILTSYYTKSETYSDDEVDTLLSGKVDKTFTISGHALNGSSLQLHPIDVELGNVKNYGMVNSPSADATNKYVDAGGLYTYLTTNYADKSDYDTTKQKVNTMWAMFQDDGNSVVDTLYDLLKVFENFPEADTIAPILSGLDSRLDTLESMGNVVVNLGSLTLDADDWEANSDSYASDYPYKYEYTNALLVGATNFSVIFGVDSDTSLLSTTAILDNETGVITFYAKDEVEDDIAIENIVAFTNMNAINTLTTNTINQVQQNKNDITDIKSQYVKKQYQYNKDGKTTTHEIATAQPNSSNISTLQIENEQSFEVEGGGTFYNRARLRLKTDKIQLNWRSGTDSNNFKNHELNIDTDGFELKFYEKTSGVATTHSLTFDANGKLKIDDKSVATERLFTSSTDATESGGVYTLDVSGMTGIEVNDYIAYLNSGAFTTLYQVASISSGVATLNVVGSFGGGGSQLYQHNINFRLWNTSYGYVGITIDNDNPNAMTFSDVWNFLNVKGFKNATVFTSMQYDKVYNRVNGYYNATHKSYRMLSIYAITSDNSIGFMSTDAYGNFTNGDVVVYDTPVAL